MLLRSVSASLWCIALYPWRSLTTAPYSAAAMQTGRKRKSSALVPNVQQAGAQGATHTESLHRKLRSYSASLAAAAVGEEQPGSASAAVADGAPAVVATPVQKAKRNAKAQAPAIVKEQADSAPAAATPKQRAKHKAKPAQQLVPLPQPLLAVAPPVLAEVLPAWTRERLSAAAEHLRRVDSSAHAGCRCLLTSILWVSVL